MVRNKQYIHKIAVLIFMAFSSFMKWESWGLEFYTSLDEAVPFWLSAVMGIMSIIWFMPGPAVRPEDVAFFPDRWGDCAYLVDDCCPGGYGRSLGYSRFQLMMFLFLAFMFLILGKQSVWLTLVIAIMDSVRGYHVLGGYLDVQVPVSPVSLFAKLGL